MVNLLLWGIWWANHGLSMHPWPIWATVGWGIGIAAHGIETYSGEGYKDCMVEKEYERLKNK